MEVLIYITGAVALFSTLINFFFDNKRIILCIQCVTLIFYGTHLFLLGGIASAFLLYAQIFRNIFFAFTFQRIIQTGVLAILITLYIYIYLQNKEVDSHAYLTLIGTILGTLGCWANNTRLVRILFLISTIPWAIYVAQIGSLFAIVLQVTFTTGILISIVRFDILKNKKILGKK